MHNKKDDDKHLSIPTSPKSSTTPSTSSASTTSSTFILNKHLSTLRTKWSNYIRNFKFFTRLQAIYLSCTPPRIRRYILWFFIIVLFIMEIEDQYMIRLYISKRTTLLTSDQYKRSKNNLQLLSTDFHIGPINDLKSTLSHYPKLKVDIMDLSLSEACKHIQTCATKETLHVLQSGNPKHSLYFSYETRMEFFNVYRKAHFNYYTTYTSPNTQKPIPWYKDILSFVSRRGKLYSSIPDYFSADTVLARADAVICSHPVGMCELYMPFNISIILWATTRFEQAREDDVYRLEGLIKNIQAIGSKPYNSIVANNLYDVAYIEYFTGIKPIYIPSLCDYTGVKYAWPGAYPKSATDGTVGLPQSLFLIPVFGYRPGIQPTSMFHFLQPPNNILHGRHLPFRVQNIHEMYERRYEYSELVTDHPAVIHIPYQVSVMSFFEQYRMGIPIFVPSLQLLTRWQMRYLMVGEKGWKFFQKSLVSRHPNATSGNAHYRAGVPYWDPNDDDSYGAIAHWLNYADYYNFPHIILFDSWEELADKLESTDFRAVSEAMHEYSKYLEAYVISQWKKIFKRVRTSGNSRLTEEPYDPYHPFANYGTNNNTLLQEAIHGDKSLSTASISSTSTSPSLRHIQQKYKKINQKTNQDPSRLPWNKYYTNKLLYPDFPDDFEVDYYMRMNELYGENNWAKY